MFQVPGQQESEVGTSASGVKDGKVFVSPSQINQRSLEKFQHVVDLDILADGIGWHGVIVGNQANGSHERRVSRGHDFVFSSRRDFSDSFRSPMIFCRILMGFFCEA